MKKRDRLSLGENDFVMKSPSRPEGKSKRYL